MQVLFAVEFQLKAALFLTVKTATETATAQKNKLAKENGKLFGQKKGAEKKGEDTSALEAQINANMAASVKIDEEIAEDKRYSNITELWLGGDHYKWRAMRANSGGAKGFGRNIPAFAAGRCRSPRFRQPFLRITFCGR